MTERAATLEAVLFVASEPLELERLADSLGATTAETTAALAELEAHLTGGIRLSSHQGRYQLVTTPAAAEAVKRHLTEEANVELSRPALETLAIIAYRGPLTKSAIDELRGVASDAMVRNLLQRDLIVEHGRANEPGKPTLYAISHTFLNHFGLASAKDLPPLAEAADEA